MTRIQLPLNSLESFSTPGQSLPGGQVSQLIPSPTGEYTALVLDHPEDDRAHTRVLRVIGTNEVSSEPPTPLHEVLLIGSGVPRLTWMFDDTLLIDEGETVAPRTIKGEVILVFAPWQVRVSPRVADPLVVSRPFQGPPGGPPYLIPGLSLSADFAVLAGGGYGGKGSESTISVSVDHPSKPVVLMLAAHASSIWSIQCAAGTTLLAVLVSGFHRQTVTGLDANIPVALHTREDESPCGYFRVDERQLWDLNQMSLRFFAREVDKIYQVQEGALFMGKSPPTHTPWIGRGDAPVEANRVEPVFRPSPTQELDEAVREGLLRRANVTDKHLWDEAMAQLRSRSGMSPRRDRHPSRSLFRSSKAYVVLKPMTLPKGLYGSRSAVFFVPKGTERPRGDPGHSTIYDFNDMSSTGSLGEE